MELTVHPLLHLVEDNRNGLKMILKHYIDYTVDDQFDHLKNSILKMILNGLINPLYSESDLKFHDIPSSTNNVDYNDAPNDDDDNDQSILVGISSFGENQSAKEEIYEFDDGDDDDDLSYQTDPQQHTEISASFASVQPSPSNHQNDPSNASIAPSTMNNNSTDQFTTDQITLSPTNQFQTSTKQSNTNLTNHNEDSDYVNYINEDKDKEENVEGDDETEQIQIDQDDKKSRQLDELQKANTIQPPIGQSQVKGKSTTFQRKLVNRKTDEPVVNQQSIPSNSGLNRSSGRKRIPKKMFGDDDAQSNVELKRKRQRTKSKGSKTLIKVNREVIQQNESVTKQLQTTTLVEVNCTEPGCKMILNSRELLKRHLLKYHGKKPYDDNVKHNQHDQTKYKYACTECDVVCISPLSLNLHWRHTHEAGEFKCSDCAFVANFRRELLIHQQANHRSSRFECTYEGCSKVFHYNYDLERHQQIHSGERQFVCAWDSCQAAFYRFCDAIRHVRTRHFYLPESIGEQNEELKNIIDERDPKVFVKDSQTCRSKVQQGGH